jgi:transposase
MTKRTSKYTRILGLSLKEISQRLNCSIGTAHQLATGVQRKRRAGLMENYKKLLGELHGTASHGERNGQPSERL